MLAARASTVRNVSRLGRTFATVVDSAGLKVAAVDYNQPTSAVTFLIKAGSRFESKPGVANALKNFAFKSTTKRSALGTIRESELYGGLLSATLSREYLALTAEFLRGDEEFFVDVLSSFISSAKYTRHEFEEYVMPIVQSDAALAESDPATQALEVAHLLAFRSGLGASLFASPHSHITAEDIKSFAASAFTKGNIAVIGTGIDQSALVQLVEKTLSAAPSSSSPTTASPSAYYGGETRLQAHGGLQTVFIGFGATGKPSADVATLSAYLSPESSVKWSKGVSPLAASLPTGTSVRSVYLPYSDATLFGLLVQGPTSASVKEAGTAAVKLLKEAAAGTGIKPEALKSAIAKAKFSAANAVDGRTGIVSALGAKILSGVDVSLESTLSSFDAVNAAAFSKAASTLLKRKPVYVTVGDVDLPYPDELGL